jgi:hypothetical protein
MPAKPFDALVVGQVAALLTDRLGVAAATARAVAVDVGVFGPAARDLGDYLREQLQPFSSSDSRVPKSVVHVAYALHECGYTVVLPQCAGCGRPSRHLPNPVAEGRLCNTCGSRRRRRACTACGKLMFAASDVARDTGLCRSCRSRAPAVRRCTDCGGEASFYRRLPPGVRLCERCYLVRYPELGPRLETCAVCGARSRAGQRLAGGGAICQRCYRPPQRPCSGCGRTRPVAARTDSGPVCRGCYQRPLRICGLCGQHAPWARRPRDEQPGVCYDCLAPVVAACTACGKVRAVRRSRAAGGMLLCSTCAATTACDLCSQVRPIIARWPIGAACAACYHRTRRNVAPCPSCGQPHPLVGLDRDGRRVCSGCAGLALDYHCRRCRRSGLLIADGLCFNCLAHDRVNLLLADGQGVLPARLRPLIPALLSAGTGQAVWRWLDPPKTPAKLVRQIATGTEPVSHDLLDMMPPSQALHRLRAVLVHGGVPAPRAEYLARIQPWLEQLLAEQPPSRANPVRAWVHWTLLRRARSRLSHRVFTAAAAHWMRSCIIAAIRFLAWIEATNRQLETLTQHDVDLWLSTQHAEHAYVAREFLRWPRSRGLTGDVAIPKRPPADNPNLLTDEERWQHLDRCLGDTGLPDDVRAAGALNLLYGLTVSRISRLRSADLHSSGGRTQLMLGEHRLRLAPAVAQLVHRCATDADGWLFPGGHPGTHASAGLHRKLKRHGLPDADRSRVTALINLAADLPAPVLADLLGLHIQTATAWARHAGSDWTAYLSARIGDTAPASPPDGDDVATLPTS